MGRILLDFDCKGNPDFLRCAGAEWANRGAVLRGIMADGNSERFGSAASWDSRPSYFSANYCKEGCYLH
jgi:hypothetical protein